MGEWFVRPHPSVGWQVLTPARTQAAVAASRPEAVRKAVGMVADEGGGRVAVADEDGALYEQQRIAPSPRPYQRQG